MITRFRRHLAVAAVSIAALGCEDDVVDQTNGHRADPNPHQPHPALPPTAHASARPTGGVDASPAPHPPGHPLPTPNRCRFQFWFTWHGIHGGGVRWKATVTPGPRSGSVSDENSGGRHFTLEGLCSAVAEAHLDPIKPDLFDEPQGWTQVRIVNLNNGRTAEDRWPNELAGAAARLVP